MFYCFQSLCSLFKSFLPSFIDMQFCDNYQVVFDELSLRYVSKKCGDGYRCFLHEGYSSVFDYAFGPSEDLWICAGISVGAAIACLIIYAWLRSYKMTVTDKRVYGKTAFGKRVDLPVDSVSAIGSRWSKGVAVSTSSGRISFLMIKNRDEIHNCVSKLLIERQNKPIPPSVVKQEALMSTPEKLKKYKELLDMGVITQEEFEVKKKQLLEL